MTAFFESQRAMTCDSSHDDARRLTQQHPIRSERREPDRILHHHQQHVQRHHHHHHQARNRNHFSIFDRSDMALLFVHVPGINAANSRVQIKGRILTIRCRHYVGKFHLNQSIHTRHLSALIVDGVLVLKAPKTQEISRLIPERITPTHVIPSEA